MRTIHLFSLQPAKIAGTGKMGGVVSFDRPLPFYNLRNNRFPLRGVPDAVRGRAACAGGRDPEVAVLVAVELPLLVLPP